MPRWGRGMCTSPDRGMRDCHNGWLPNGAPGYTRVEVSDKPRGWSGSMNASPQADPCLRCGTSLARDNDGKLCGSCSRRAIDMRFSPPALPDSFWKVPLIREALGTRHMGKVLRAFRIHPYH